MLNQFDPSLPLHLDIREVLREQLGDRLLPFVLRRAPAVSEALAEGMTVMDYAPNSTVAEDFGSLAGWVKSQSAPASSTYRGVRWSETMTASGLWQDIGAGENFFTKLLRLIFLLAAAACFCFLAMLAAHLAAAGGAGTADPADGAGDGAQFRLLPGHADADDDVDVLHLSLRILAHHAGGAVLSGSGQSLGRTGCVLHHLPAAGRGLRIRHSVSRLLSDHLAAAARAGVAAREYR